MKRIAIVFILLVFLHPLFSDGLDVLSSNEEITAYKHMNIPVEPEDPQTPPSDPTTISFKILNPVSNSEIGSGEDRKLTTSVLTEANYLQNTDFNNVFSWEMKGNQFTNNSIIVGFTFGPLTSESVSFSNSMTVSDKTKVIPYSVTLYSNETTVSGISGNIGTSQITSSNYSNSTNSEKYYSITSGNYTYRFYLADSRTYSGNGVSITTSSRTVTLSCNMYTNSFVKRYRTSNGNTNNTNYKNNFSTCNEWTRSGYVSVELGLEDNGYSWSETVNGNKETYNLERGSATYTANVVVTVTGV